MIISRQMLRRVSPEALAMRLSLAVGLGMLAAKIGAYALTGSAAIFSDAAESVVHVLAVAFAAFSLWLSDRPAGRRTPYGYERIAFFSAGFEGLVIVLVAVAIIWATVLKWRQGIELQRIGAGLGITVAAVIVNGVLGWYLIRTGHRHNSLILVANGKHVLTDSWTSLGAVAGLVLVLATGWRPFDPLFAIATAVNILWTGVGLMVRSGYGLMDVNESQLDRDVGEKLDRIARELGVEYHNMRTRDTGRRLLVSLHLLFPYECTIGEAHRRATELETRLEAMLGRPAEVTTHLEALEDHGHVHQSGRG